MLALALALLCDPGDARVVRVSRVAPDAVAVVVREGEVALGKLVPYEAEPGDRITNDESRVEEPSTSGREVYRDGKFLGKLAGPKTAAERFLRTPDTFSGQRADAGKLQDPAAWSLSGPASATVVKVHRKTRGLDVADVGWPPPVTYEHTLTLVLDQPITDGQWTVASTDPLLGSTDFEVSDAAVSDAVHATLVGYRPGDPGKAAFLSWWPGDAGGLNYEDPAFRLIDAAGDVAAEGTAEVWRYGDQKTDYRGLRARPNGSKLNTAGVTVRVCELPDDLPAGVYRVQVAGVGSSREFPVSDDVYKGVFKLVQQGLKAHRWGTDETILSVGGDVWERPAAVPKSHQSYADVPVYYTESPATNANFGDFAKGRTGPFEGDVSGGYMDAGDFDRNFNHNVLSYYLLDLVRSHPGHADALLAGTLEAALHNVDLWVRLQRPDGGALSAIEYAEHPVSMEPSWLNSLPVYVCGPSAESTRLFAAAAAKAAATLSALGRDGADAYERAARRAYDWLAENGETTDRVWPAAELYAATGEARFRDDLVELTKETNPWSILEQDDLPGVISALERGGLPGDRAEVLRGAVGKTLEAVWLEGSARRQPYRNLKHGWVGMSYGTGTWPDPHSCNVLRGAKLLGGEIGEELRAAATAGLAMPLGANPLNMTLCSGLTERSPENGLHIDSRATGHRLPVGIPLYGFTQVGGAAWPAWNGIVKVHPEYGYWPAYENFHEYWLWAEMTEYTVHQTFTTALYFSGALSLD